MTQVSTHEHNHTSSTLKLVRWTDKPSGVLNTLIIPSLFMTLYYLPRKHDTKQPGAAVPAVLPPVPHSNCLIASAHLSLRLNVQIPPVLIRSTINSVPLQWIVTPTTSLFRQLQSSWLLGVLGAINLAYWIMRERTTVPMKPSGHLFSSQTDSWRRTWIWTKLLCFLTPGKELERPSVAHSHPSFLFNISS